MDMSSVNWLAVVACVVTAQVIGFLWYSKPVFLLPWLDSIGKDEGFTQTAPPTSYLINIVASLVEAIFVSFLVSAMGSMGFLAGLTAGFMIWLGFVATTSSTNAAFAQRGLKNWLIESGNHLVTLLVMAAILASWR